MDFPFYWSNLNLTWDWVTLFCSPNSVEFQAGLWVFFTPGPQTSSHYWNLMNLILSVWRRMFSYMYEFNFPKYDYNANSIEVQRSNVREKSARERSKLRRSKSSHSLDCKVRPKSHRFRREKDCDPRYYYNQNNELKLIDLEEENASTNFSAWCVSFDSEKVKFRFQPASDPLDYRKRD